MHMPTMRWLAAAPVGRVLAARVLAGRVLAGPVLAGAVLAGLSLAACGTQQAATTTSSATQAASSPASSPSTSPARPGGVLCRDTAAVTRLVVTRVNALPQNHLHFAVPAGVTISDPATARGVAQAICGLPAMPHGQLMSCPADLGVSYRLSFAAGRAAFPVVTITAGGCGGVSGAGPVRRATSATFWTDLAKALGAPHPGAATLQGTS
jgi:hypothetical protein